MKLFKQCVVITTISFLFITFILFLSLYYGDTQLFWVAAICDTIVGFCGLFYILWFLRRHV